MEEKLNKKFAKIKKILENAKVCDIEKKQQDIVTVSDTDSPVESFKKILENNIQSAPVLITKKDKDDKDEKYEYCGFLDVRDLVSLVVFIYDEKVRKEKLDFLGKLTKVPLFLAGVIDAVMPLKVNVTTSYLAKRNLFKPLKSDANLLQVLAILAEGVHRVPIVDDNGKVINIISQSSIVRFLHDFKDELNLDMKVEDCIYTHPVISVKESTLAIDAFKTMSNKHISGLAIVDEDGKLTLNTSGSDLKLFLNNPSLGTLKQPIFDFIKEIRINSHVKDTKALTVSVRKTDNLAHAIGRLAVCRVHRLYVADSNHGYKPQGVLALKDIIRYIVKNMPE